MISNQSASLFTRFSKKTARASGSPLAFVLAAGTIVVWAITGPLFKYSDTWQLVINTATTVVTFLMVFLIQNTQNRDSEALQIKIDELIRCVDGAQEALMDLEEMEEKEIHTVRKRYRAMAEEARRTMRNDPDLGIHQRDAIR